MESIIIGTERGTCFICGRMCQTHKHHVFGAYNRKRAERDGLFVYLCPECHRMVHSDYMANVSLKEMAEIAWLDTNQKNINDFIAEYGRNYIGFLR